MAIIANVTRGTVLAGDARAATNLWTRLVGLMGRAHLPAGAALYFPRVQGVQTCFMRFPIDLVFYDRDLVVLRTIERLPPWRFSPFLRRAGGVVELPAGAVRTSGTQPGDALAISAAPPPTDRCTGI